MKPTLPYPDPVGHCIHCRKSVAETDLFGFIYGELFCVKDFRFYRRINPRNFEKKWGIIRNRATLPVYTVMR